MEYLEAVFQKDIVESYLLVRKVVYSLLSKLTKQYVHYNHTPR